MSVCQRMTNTKGSEIFSQKKKRKRERTVVKSVVACIGLMTETELDHNKQKLSYQI